MTDLVFKFEPAHLKTYQKLATERAYGAKRGGSWDVEWVRFLLCAVGVAAGFAAFDLALPALTGRPLAYLELLLGFVAGIGVMLGAMWWRYAKSWARAFRDDGPTMSEHRISLTPEGVRSVSAQTDTLYRWPAIDEVAVHDDVILIWIEPGCRRSHSAQRLCRPNGRVTLRRAHPGTDCRGQAATIRHLRLNESARADPVAAQPGFPRPHFGL